MLGSDQMRLVRAIRNAGISDGSISLDLSRSIQRTHGCWSIGSKQDNLKADQCAGYASVLKT
jgi:hypothetical protein